MPRRRSFFPPACCESCAQRPIVGHTLLHTGQHWLCPNCLTQQSDGDSVINKVAKHSLEADLNKSLSRRARTAGEIEKAVEHNKAANWHLQAVSSIKDEGKQVLRSANVLNGEIAPSLNSWLKETLIDPDLPAIDASHMRGRLLEDNNVTAMAIDTSNTMQASNSAERLISHQMALAHKIAFEQAAIANIELDSDVKLKRLQIVSRMMKSSQEAALTLQKLKNGGPQSVTVQHVHVESGGQALVGNVRR